MARVGDAPYPNIDVDIHPDCDNHGLHVCINFFLADVNPLIALWDRAHWDDTRTGTGWSSDKHTIDITGDVVSLVVERPESSDLGQPGNAEMTMELSNKSGRYTQIDDLGQLHDKAIGCTIHVWHEDVVNGAPTDDWIFFGHIATWEEDYGIGPNPTGASMLNKITCTAYDATFMLNSQVSGMSYPMGLEGETVPSRLAYLASLVMFDRGLKLDAGTVALRNVESTNPVYESMQIAAESDGGYMFIDNDGQIMYLNRNTWLAGRKDQPKPIPVFSDTCDDVSFTYWDGDPITDDIRIRNMISLTNVDGVMVMVRHQPSIDRFHMRMMNLEEQLWTYEHEGSALASYWLGRLYDAFFRIGEFSIYGNGWPLLRVGDLIRYVRTLPDGTHIDTNLVISGTSYEFSPGGMVCKYSTFRVASVNVFTRWDTADAKWDSSHWTF